MPLKIITSNRLENLSAVLASTLSIPIASPMAPEIIVVQSGGMQRWLSLELAKKLGVCANIRFPFPNAFIHEITCGIFPDLPEHSTFEPTLLTWRIMKLLPDCLTRPVFQPLQTYLREPGSGLKRLQLAVRIADLFDQYLLFRPDMILNWERGKNSHWQAALWRELVAEEEALHRAALGKRLTGHLLSAKTRMLDLPERISVFGISSLPEFHMQIFDALSKHVAVKLFLLNPCREYWGDIRTKREQRFTASAQEVGQLSVDFTAADLHFDEGNALLASLGKMGREFFDLLEDKLEFASEEHFGEPDESSLLACLQSDILTLTNREGLLEEPGENLSESMEATLISDKDRSIQVHACHSERREIEVLQDHLLAMFAQDAALEPGDVLVMAPDIEPYVPFIQSVFDLPYQDSRRLPYGIADRSYGRESELVVTFFAILNLHNSRCSATEIFGILENSVVHENFGIEATDLEIIRNWLQQTHIRWGKDAAHRAQLGLPGISQNTWRSGLERLLLGYALGNDNEEIYDAKILPFAGVEGGQAEVLGFFVEYVERLFSLVEALEQDRTLVEWSETLTQILTLFFMDNAETGPQLQIMRQAIAELSVFQDVAGFDEKLELRVVRQYLQNKLQREGHGFGFLSGGITFCSMLPMRSIPAKVICLIGMNNDAYPRSVQPLGFDLIAQNPRKGDRSRRNDDRYLFLEALFSARGVLYLSYIGQSTQDNSIIPPSVLVSEFISYLDSNYQVSGASKASDQICVKHRLQAFSPDYFLEDQHLFSYSRENLEAAVAISSGAKKWPAFFDSKALPEPGDEFRSLRLEDLCLFFKSPVQYFFNKRLGVRFNENVDLLEDSEIFSLSGLERYLVAADLLTDARSLAQVEEIKAKKRLAGQLPHGAVGDVTIDALEKNVKRFADKLQALDCKELLPPIEVDLSLAGFNLSGKLAPVYDTGLVLHRYAKVKARDHLQIWIHHLLLNLCNEKDSPNESIWAGLDSLNKGNWSAWRYLPVPEAEKYLAELLQLYWLGLQKPFRFFPESTYAYWDKFVSSKGEESAALRAAGKAWYGSDYAQGELQDLYLQRCFKRDENPFTAEFMTLAEQVWEPIFKNRLALEG